MRMDALALATLALILVSCALRPKWHAGLLGIGASILLAVAFTSGAETGMGAGAAPFRHFPTSLFLNLAGVMLFFGMAEANGTLDLLTRRAIALVGGRRILLPFTLYGLVSALTAAGMGNIPVVAFVAPLGLRIARETGMPGMAMSLLIVGAANGAVFSPVSIAGVVVGQFLAGTPAHSVGLDLATGPRLFLIVASVQVLVTSVGFFLFGGGRWLRSPRRGNENVPLGDVGSSTAHDGSMPSTCRRAQRGTMAVLAVFASALLVSSLPSTKAWVTPGWTLVLGNVGALSFLGACTLMIMGWGHFETAVTRLPWGILLLVTGMVMLTGQAEELGALRLLTSALISASTEGSVAFWLGLASGALSSFSSSTGVVLPLFLPLIPSLHASFEGASSFGLLVAVGLGSHIVDASPLSTLGALCVSGEPDAGARRRLFRSLLFWGLAMIPAGATAAWCVTLASQH